MDNLSTHLDRIKDSIRKSSKLDIILNLEPGRYEELLDAAKEQLLFEHDNLEDFINTAVLYSPQLYQILDIAVGFNQDYEDL